MDASSYHWHPELGREPEMVGDRRYFQVVTAGYLVRNIGTNALQSSENTFSVVKSHEKGVQTDHRNTSGRSASTR